MNILIFAAEAATPIADFKDIVGVGIYSLFIALFVGALAYGAFKFARGAGQRIGSVAGIAALLAVFAIPPAGDGIINFFGSAIERATDQGNSALVEEGGADG